MEIGNRDECNHHCRRMGIDDGIRQSAQRAKQQLGNRGLPNPAERKTGQRDTELHRGKKIIEPLLQTLDSAGASAARINELLNARVANTDNGELGSHKKGVQGHQQHDHKDAEEHQRRHHW